MGVHELAHVVMMLACGGRVRRLTLRFADLRIDAAGLGYRQELLAALAGPLVNLVCGALFCMRSPAFAAYSLMLGIYNLLPVWPLDGGRAVRCALAQHLPLARAEAVSRRSSFAVCAALLLAGDHPDVFPPRRALAARHGGVSDAPAADTGKAHGRIAPTGSSGRETERYRLLFMPAAVTMK